MINAYLLAVLLLPSTLLMFLNIVVFVIIYILFGNNKNNPVKCLAVKDGKRGTIGYYGHSFNTI